jgi:uncharacterized membrane protein YhaH (DUF805 family)
MEEPRSRIYFLFRTDAGRIDAPTWWRSTLLLVGIFVVLTIGWHLIQPYGDHDLDTTLLFTIGIFAANLYRLLYGFAVIMILICYYNLSAKRWRDIGRPAALAGLLPLLACIAGALHWIEPRVDPDMPHAIPIAADITLAAVFVWNVIELGGLNLRTKTS